MPLTPARVTRRAGEDAVLEEHHVLAILRDPMAMITPKFGRGLCSTVLLIAHSHRVTIEAFVEMLNNVSQIHSVLSDLECAGRMISVLQDVDPTRDVAFLNQEIERKATEWNAHRRALADKLELVMQCPTADDTIN